MDNDTTYQVFTMSDEAETYLSDDSLSYSYYGDNIWPELPKIENYMIITLTAIFAVSVILSSVGNIVVICVMTCARRGKSSINALMVNLAMSDWTLGLVCLPFLFTQAMITEWVFGKSLCYIVPFAFKVSQIVSIYTVTVIGIDRYQVVMYPLGRKLSHKGKNIIIVIIWLTAVALAVPQIIYAEFKTIEVADTSGGKNVSLCGNDWPNSSIDSKKVYIWLLFALTYVVPLFLLSGCYIRMALKLWRRTLPGHIDAERDREQEMAKKKAIRTLVSLIILFAMCWLPLNFYNLFIISYNDHYLQTHPEVTITSRACVFIWLVLSDTIFNPIVYVFLSENFRKNIRMLIYRAKTCFGMKVELPYSDVTTYVTMVSSTRHRGKQHKHSIALHTM